MAGTVKEERFSILWATKLVTPRAGKPPTLGFSHLIDICDSGGPRQNPGICRDQSVEGWTYRKEEREAWRTHVVLQPYAWSA